MNIKRGSKLWRFFQFFVRKCALLNALYRSEGLRDESPEG